MFVTRNLMRLTERERERDLCEKKKKLARFYSTMYVYRASASPILAAALPPLGMTFFSVHVKNFNLITCLKRTYLYRYNSTVCTYIDIWYETQVAAGDENLSYNYKRLKKSAPDICNDAQQCSASFHWMKSRRSLKRQIFCHIVIFISKNIFPLNAILTHYMCTHCDASIIFPAGCYDRPMYVCIYTI